MKIIVGLGNPGKKYEHTRHNAGFLALDYALGAWGMEHGAWSKKYESETLETEVNNQKVLLVKPQTYMNETGKAVKTICDFYKIDVSHDLLVMHDDSDLPSGSLRMTDSSSSAGHKGVQDIIDTLGKQDFHRIRIGVESRASREEMPTDAFVLQNFTPDELKKLKEDVFPKVKDEIRKFIEIDGN